MAKPKVVPVYNPGGSTGANAPTVPKGSKPPSDPSVDLYNKQKSDALAAENRALARERETKRKAGQRFLAAGTNLEAQAKAIEDALKNQFGKQLKSNLADVGLNLKQQVTMLTEGAKARGQEFVNAARDNEKATGDTLAGSAQNMTRERQDAMAQLLQQGAGETDSMRAMLMSARNMQANATEANRAYYDTTQSINTGITDLNVDTKTALQNMYMSAEQEKDRLWTDFYNRRSEAFTQLGNIRGQQADYIDQAKELGVGYSGTKTKKIESQRDAAFKYGARELGKDYKQQALPNWAKNYKGQAKVEERQSNTNLAAAVTIDKAEKADGASLRRWEG